MRKLGLILSILLLLMSGCGRERPRTGHSRSQGSNVTQTSASNRRDKGNNVKTVSENKDDTYIPTNTGGKKMTGSEIFEKYNPAVFYILTADNSGRYQGSGFFVTSDGVGVSNYHVFQGTYLGAEELQLTDGGKLKIDKVIAKSEKFDFIVFKVKHNGRTFKYIPLTTHKSRVGDKVFAIGSPKGLRNTFSSGEISQFRDELIQISVPIDHGSSGGALINEYGEVIGITSAGYDDTHANLNFAEDINNVRKYIK